MTVGQILNFPFLTGYERDEATGLDYANARMYASNAARFTSPDPSSLRSADPRRPESLNRYSYVENDPVNAFDPSGRNLEAPNGSSRRSCRFIYGFRGPDDEDIIYFSIVGISCSEVSLPQVGGSDAQLSKALIDAWRSKQRLNSFKEKNPDCDKYIRDQLGMGLDEIFGKAKSFIIVDDSNRLQTLEGAGLGALGQYDNQTLGSYFGKHSYGASISWVDGYTDQGNRPITSRNRGFYVQDFKQIAAIPTGPQSLGLNTTLQCCFLL